jgi:5-methylcytosine-specific restriction endonuclease McrA
MLMGRIPASLLPDHVREQINAKARERYALRREEECERARRYDHAHRAEIRETKRRWKAANPEKVQAARARYRARCVKERQLRLFALSLISARRRRADRWKKRLRSAPGFRYTTAAKVAARWDLYGGRCYYCKGEATQIDHRIPLSRGGTHWPANLVPACGPCNQQKRARTEREYRRILIPALAGALILLFPATQAGAQTYHPNTAEQRLVNQIVYHRNMTWHWQDRAHHKRLSTQHRESIATLPLLARLKHYWEHRHYLAWRGYKRYEAKSSSTPAGLPPHYLAWMCIHGGEGAWTSATGNGFYGGLQMDYGFMSTYGGDLLRTKGTANNWTPLEQMWVAERAYQSGRGFYPWPATARNCGLI